MLAKPINGVAPVWTHSVAAAAPTKSNTRQNVTGNAPSDAVTLSPRAKALQLYAQGDPASAIALILDLNVTQVNEYLRISAEQNSMSTTGQKLPVVTGPASHGSSTSRAQSGDTTTIMRAQTAAAGK